MPLKVRNAVNTSKNQDVDGNLKRWKEVSGNENPKNAQYGVLKNDDLVGAHVEILEGKDKGEIVIVPLDRKLNGQREAAGEFYIRDDVYKMSEYKLQN